MYFYVEICCVTVPDYNFVICLFEKCDRLSVSLKKALLWEEHVFEHSQFVKAQISQCIYFKSIAVWLSQLRILPNTKPKA